MEIDSRPGEGTRIELTLPLPAALGDDSIQRAATEEGIEESRLRESQEDVSAPPSRVQVAVADDHAVVRQGIANLLAHDDRTTVVGQAADGHEVIEMVEQERPDVVLMDVNMPNMNGVEATREIRSRWPNTAIVGLSVQADRATERSMLEAGADAFIPKSGDVDQILETVLRVTDRSSPWGE